MAHVELTTVHLDAMRELLNIGVGRAAAELNEMVESPINLSIPELTLGSRDDVLSRWAANTDTPVAAIYLPFSGTVSGSAILGFPVESATKLVSLLADTSAEEAEEDEIRIMTLTEVGNILLNSVMGSISNALEGDLIYQVPSFLEDTAAHVMDRGAERENPLLIARAHFNVESPHIEGDVHVVFSVGSFTDLVNAVDRAS